MAGAVSHFESGSKALWSMVLKAVRERLSIVKKGEIDLGPTSWDSGSLRNVVEITGRSVTDLRLRLQKLDRDCCFFLVCLWR